MLFIIYNTTTIIIIIRKRKNTVKSRVTAILDDQKYTWLRPKVHMGATKSTHGYDQKYTKLYYVATTKSTHGCD